MTIVRIATPDDVSQVETVVRLHWDTDINHEKELSNANSIFLVAEKDSLILGTALMWVVDWNKTGNLVELFVKKGNQRTGLGSALVDELATQAKNRGLRAITVETQPDNAIASSFYMKKGFRFCGYNDRYYTNDPKSSHDIAIFFSLDLT